jgi:hypothetical protein
MLEPNQGGNVIIRQKHQDQEMPMVTINPSVRSMRGPYRQCIGEAITKTEEAIWVAKELDRVVASSPEEDPRFSEEVTALRHRFHELLAGATHLIG